MKSIIYFTIWLATACLLSAATVDKPVIQVYLVKGDVSLINIETNETQPLKRGDLISEGYAIETQADSSTLLLFSNGASVNVAPESYVKIAEFTQQPFDMAVANYALLGEDPSPSSTELEVHYGKIIGSVRKLQPESKYVINSPTGSAGIRGTTWVFSTITKSQAVQASQGSLTSAITSLSVGEGVVELTVDGTTYVVNAGETKTITVTFADGSTGELEISSTEEAPDSGQSVTDAQLLTELNEMLTEAENNTTLVSPGAPGENLVLTPLRTGNDPTNFDSTNNITNPTNSPF
ncbi:FecR family protein [Cerasicoccus fimbriatus]|uniref:FecR family protein n=1 Tax=Cerasicoccus fimbriatus TaxID=3014554 RepID=UPI0022B35361|nr:FecR domain-containing protein [Cerasicoccus sp. TK19100]